MALPPPPNPLTPDELRRRYRPGISMHELDPELAKWADENARFYRWAMRAVCGAAAVCLVVLLILALFR